ncbi:MAG: NUDIX hydrolase [Verrucomicrobiota bacterium JB023]|nr:NUDIX hydrolase [Verrucomicrobiota bacterium JB023]
MNWLELGRELSALAQSGLHYGKDVYDRERYQRLKELAAEVLSAGADLEPETILEWKQAEFGYATPKVDVRAFCLREGKVLLVRENLDEGRWTLPGGWADVNESPSQAVEREVEEECGLTVEARRLLAFWDRERQGNPPPYPFHIWKVFFHCEITGGEARKTLEGGGCDFFARDELPELSAARVIPSQIERCFDLLESGRTDFD